jgi:hypothetical protein
MKGALMITTVLDLLGALLIILGLTALVGTYAPLWVTLITAGVLVTVLSLLITKRRGGAK